MNFLLGVISIILLFSSILLIDRFFKKDGLIVYITFATITANIIVCKTIDLFNITTSLGNIMFASNFLASEIINDKYGKEVAYKAILISLFMSALFTVSMNVSLLYVSSSEDIYNEALKTLFSFNLRSTSVSCLLFFLSNSLDIYLFDKLKKKYSEKLWFRNNISTIIANCSENYLFAFLVFLGIYDIKTILSIATTGSIIEIILSFCSTPFLYLALKNKSV